ncbi:MAG: hypothetical protein LBJ03_02890 [Holosporales bacterium]|jgi:hypothetical protein|nr:hypothetical protein [Holosporales bacterium]
MKNITVVIMMFVCQSALSMLRPVGQDGKSSTLPITMSNAHYDRIAHQSADLKVDIDEISSRAIQNLQDLQNGVLLRRDEIVLINQCSDCLSAFDIAYLNPYGIK